MLDGTEPGLLLEWLEYYQLEPFGAERDDLRNAVLCQFIADSLGVKKPGGRLKLDDFMPEFDREEPKVKFNPEVFKAEMKRRYGNTRKSSR